MKPNRHRDQIQLISAAKRCDSSRRSAKASDALMLARSLNRIAKTVALLAKPPLVSPLS